MYKILIFFLLVSCNNYSLKNYSLYRKSSLVKSDFLPTNRDFDKIKVAIIIKNKTNFKSRGINVAQVARGAIENILKDIKNIEIVDKAFIKTIKKELDAEEIIFDVDNAKKADYIFLITMDSLTFTSRYDSNSVRKIGYEAIKLGTKLGVSAISPFASGTSTDTAESNTTFGKYRYKATFTGSLSIIKAQNLEKIGTISLMGHETDKESIQDFISVNNAKTYDPEVIRKSIVKAINSSSAELANYLPVVGFIAERMDYKQEQPILFKTTFGLVDGIKEGDTVFLKRTVYDQNPFTGENQVSIEEIKLGKVIFNDLKNHFCWIKVKKKELAESLKMGDKVIVYLNLKKSQ